MTSPEMFYASLATSNCDDVEPSRQTYFLSSDASVSSSSSVAEETSPRPTLMVRPSSVRSSSMMSGEVAASPTSGEVRVAANTEEESTTAASDVPQAVSSDTSQAASVSSSSPRKNIIKTLMGDLSSRFGSIAALNSTVPNNDDAVPTVLPPGSPKTTTTNYSSTTASDSAGGAVSQAPVDDGGNTGGGSSARSTESATNDATSSEDLESTARSSSGTHDAVASVSDDEEDFGSNGARRQRRSSGKRTAKRIASEDAGDPQASLAKSDDLGSILAPIHEDDEEGDDDNADAARERLNLALDSDTDDSGNPQLSPKKDESASSESDAHKDQHRSRDDASSAASAATGIFVIGQMIGMGKNEFGRLLRSRHSKTDEVAVEPEIAPRTAQQQARDIEEGVPPLPPPTRPKRALPPLPSTTTSVQTAFPTSHRDEAEGVVSLSAGSRKEFVPKGAPTTTISLPGPVPDDAEVPTVVSPDTKQNVTGAPSSVVLPGPMSNSVTDEQNAQPALSPLWKFVSIFTAGEDRNSEASQKAKEDGGTGGASDVETGGDGSDVVAAKQAAKEAAKEAFFESRRTRSDQEEDNRIPLEVTRGFSDKEDDVSTLGGGKYENIEESFRGAGSIGERPFLDEEVNDGSTSGAWSSGLVVANRNYKKKRTLTRGSSNASTAQEVQHRISDMVGQVVIPSGRQGGGTRNGLPNEAFVKGWVEYMFMTIIVVCLITLIILGILVLVQRL